MSNNPFFNEVDSLLQGNESSLRTMCEQWEGVSCPCVGKSSLPGAGSDQLLTSTHPGYPDIFGTPCIKEITGDQFTSTPEYKECLLAATCNYFFPELSEKFHTACANNRECDIPTYIGYGSEHSGSSNIKNKW